MTVLDSILKSTVKEKYGEAALRIIEGSTSSACCGSTACCGTIAEATGPITSDLYDEQQHLSGNSQAAADLSRHSQATADLSRRSQAKAEAPTESLRSLEATEPREQDAIGGKLRSELTGETAQALRDRP